MSKYRYYINYNGGDYSEIYPKDNQLKHIFKIEEEHEGHPALNLEGTFILTGTDFDNIVLAKTNIWQVSLRIFENGDFDNGTEIWYGIIETFNDFDYNSSTVICKDFITIDDYYLVNETIESGIEHYLTGTTYPINKAVVTPYTSYSYKFDDIMEVLTGITNFDIDNAWYGTAGINLKKLRFANLKDMLYAEISENNTTSRKKLTLKRMLEIMRIMFRAHWYIDASGPLSLLKFKLPANFVVNILDIPTELTNLKKKMYNNGLRYGIEQLKFNSNNTPLGAGLDGDFDETTNIIAYDWYIKSKKTYELPEICTNFTKTETEYNLDGFYVAMVDDDNELRSSGGVYNGELSTKTLTTNGYRDYIYTDQANYNYCGVDETVKPTYFRPFIELPDVNYVLSSIATFYEGIKFEVDGTDEMIGRVWEMSTDLNTGITTFKTFEFMNSIN